MEMEMEMELLGAPAFFPQAGRWHEIDTELQIGAWINVRDEARRTVLLWAARQGANDAVTSLVNKTHGLMVEMSCSTCLLGEKKGWINIELVMKIVGYSIFGWI